MDFLKVKHKFDNCLTYSKETGVKVDTSKMFYINISDFV